MAAADFQEVLSRNVPLAFSHDTFGSPATVNHLGTVLKPSNEAIGGTREETQSGWQQESSVVTPSGLAPTPQMWFIHKDIHRFHEGVPQSGDLARQYISTLTVSPPVAFDPQGNPLPKSFN
jgi:hypothetical protein